MFLSFRFRNPALASVFVVLWACGPAMSQEAAYDIHDGAEILARGPLHEAFAAPVIFDPEPGVLIPQAAPDAIEEIPPDEQPEGDDIVWIDGYWSWDDEEKTFLWVSGIWRDVPPGREWVPGYWRSMDGGAQWVSGYWRTNEHETIEYLPTPPPSIEIGPSSEPPTADHSWVPGSWVWRESRYAWRSGHWIVYQPDWVWVPAQYIWTPRGCIFVDGYWDYAPVRRGVIFAPARIARVVYSRPAYVYRPRIAIDITVAVDHFFARPSVRHYYFGDYYAREYVDVGIYPSFSFHYSRFGYDPIYARRLVVHRRVDPQWEASLRVEFSRRRDRVELRPARVYSVRRETSITIAKPLSVYKRERAADVRIVKASPQSITRARKTSVELRESRTRRVGHESSDAYRSEGASREQRVQKVTLPRSKVQRERPAGAREVRKIPQRPRAPEADSNRQASPGKRRPDPRDRIERSKSPSREKPGREHPERKSSGKRRKEKRP